MIIIPSWRRRRSSRRPANESSGSRRLESVSIPNHFRCPISLDLMKDPVTLTTGITYDRESIETWIDSGNRTCPITNQLLTTTAAAALDPIVPNHTIRKMIQDWCVANKSYGVERIPTPRIPVTAVQVDGVLARITAALQRNDETGCRDLVRRIKAWGRESERNKRCIAENGGTAAVLAAAFETFSNNAETLVLTELLFVLTWAFFFPIDKEAKILLRSGQSLRAIVRLLRAGDLCARRNAVLLLKGLLSKPNDDRDLKMMVEGLEEIKGGEEALVKLIKEPICPTSTKASLVVIFHMVSSSTKDATRINFVEMGLVPLLLELLVDSEKSICEKALGVLDGICSCQEGRKMASSHALAMPVLVKKILRVSDLATEFSVSVLWKLLIIRNKEGDQGEGEEHTSTAMAEALQVGAFQKLLLLLQVGCSERCKEKASELLKLLNVHRKLLECVDSMDFKNLKRPV